MTIFIIFFQLGDEHDVKLCTQNLVLPDVPTLYGRLYLGALDAELEQISDVANANERFLVIDAQVGQSAGPVAANFHDLAGVTGIVSPN